MSARSSTRLHCARKLRSNAWNIGQLNGRHDSGGAPQNGKAWTGRAHPGGLVDKVWREKLIKLTVGHCTGESQILSVEAAHRCERSINANFSTWYRFLLHTPVTLNAGMLSATGRIALCVSCFSSEKGNRQ